MTLQEAENAFALAMVNDGRLEANDLKVIWSEKMQVIRKTGILEFIQSDYNLDDIGGLENLKNWLKKRNNSWSERAKRYCLPAPKGVLLTGIPGCGKSLTAKVTSSMWQLPLIRLDLGKIFSGLVGSSEENMRKAIRDILKSYASPKYYHKDDVMFPENFERVYRVYLRYDEENG